METHGQKVMKFRPNIRQIFNFQVTSLSYMNLWSYCLRVVLFYLQVPSYYSCLSSFFSFFFFFFFVCVCVHVCVCVCAFIIVCVCTTACVCVYVQGCMCMQVCTTAFVCVYCGSICVHPGHDGVGKTASL